MSTEHTQPDSIEVSRSIVATLQAHGVRDVVYSPGSRCAPFAYVLAQAEAEGLLRVHIRLDERGAAFFAIGLARAVDPGAPFRPVALVGTSGGAIAEYHAGVAEAFHSQIPLIIVSADRPFEMRGVGASQTTEQAGIFGPHTRGVWDIPAGPAHHVRGCVTRAIARALGRPSGVPGPVQINVGLRDPLVPSSLPFPVFPSDSAEVVSQIAERQPLPVAWEDCVDSSLRTVILAGDGADVDAVDWADAAQIPILAEPTSGVSMSPLWVPFQQAFLQPGSTLGEQIEQVVVTGRPTLSRPVSRLLARETVRVIVVSTDPEWVDVAGHAAAVVPALLPAQNAHQVTTTREAIAGDIQSPEWLAAWLSAAQTARSRARDFLRSNSDSLPSAPLSVPVVADLVWKAQVPTLILGASNTIRAIDLVASTPSNAHVISQRGLAGIDGTIATAFGLARGSEQPVRVLMGDLTFFHDVSSLAVTEPEATPDMHIIVLDDGGGGIFASLEHGRQEFSDLYPRWFATQQRADIAHLTLAYGGEYVSVSTLSELEAELARPIQGVRVTHVRVPRPDEAFAQLKTITSDTFS